MAEPLVWMPFDASELGDPPAGLRYEEVDPTQQVPDSVEEVAFYVTPYQLGPEIGDALSRMTSLEVVQTLSAGVDNVRSQVPDGVTLCSGRGIHDSSTAELALTLILASLRGVPDFVRAQDRSEWRPQWRPALADKSVLIIGYGAVGRAIETRLLPFETRITRVARSARDGVHAHRGTATPAARSRCRRADRSPDRRDPRPGRPRFPRPDEGRLPPGQPGPRCRGRHRRPGRGAPDRTDHCRGGRRRPRATSSRRAALVGPRAFDLATCRRREQRDVAARPPLGP